MAGSIFVRPKVAPINAGGVPYSGAKYTFYLTGTSTPASVYTDSDLTTPHANPVVADANGVFAPIWLDGSVSYRARLTTSSDVLIEDVDPVNLTAESGIPQAVYVTDYGADITGTDDSTAAIQQAIDTGKTVLFPAGTYKAANLTQSTANQRFYALGEVRIQKNADGPILTTSGNYFECNGIGFRGDASSPTFTGGGIVSSGSHPRFINCGVRWISGIPLKATGDHVQVLGTCDIYQTTDATGTGYDIELGVSGTATLYHQLVGVYTSQATGGIHLIDTGSHVISGGQFGKLFIDAGTSPTGVNGGMTTGARILGAVTVELSNATFAACQFGAVAISLASGTAGCVFDASNIYATGHTITNSGNANNLILREVSTGSVNQLKIGADASLTVLEFDPTTGDLYMGSGQFRLANNKAVRWKDSGGTYNASLSMSAGNNLGITNSNGSVQIAASTGNNIQNFINGVEFWSINSSGQLRAGASGTPFITSGSATPEAAVTAPVGSLYMRTGGGAGTTFYVKETGTGNTGWVAK